MTGDLVRLDDAPQDVITRTLADAVAVLPALPPAEPGQRYAPRPATVAWLLDATPHTRRAYYNDLALWLGWCHHLDIDPFAARRMDVDAWRATLPGAPSTVARRIAAVSSWYQYLLSNDAAVSNPTAGVRRPKPGGDTSPTVSLTGPEATALLAAADARAQRSPSEARLRDTALLRLMLTTALRVGTVTRARARDYGQDAGHRVLRYITKGAKRRVVVVPPAATVALDVYLDARAARLGVSVGELDGPLLCTMPYRHNPGGQPLTQRTVWDVLRATAAEAGLASAEHLSPHSLRHTALTLLMGSGVPLADVQDLADHADPRTTRRYDAGRRALDRSPAYALSAMVAPTAPSEDPP